MAEICAPDGFLPAALGATLGAAGAALSTAGFAGALSGSLASLGAAAGPDSVFGSVLDSAAGSKARTAAWQPGERLDMFCCRHCSDAAPPGGTLAQWAS